VASNTPLFPLPAIEGEPLYPSKAALKRALREQFGSKNYKITQYNEVWVRMPLGTWRLLGDLDQFTGPTKQYPPEDGPQQIDGAPMQEARP